LIALGFRPTARGVDGGGLTFCVGNCPYSAAVGENQPAVCTLHKGITVGLLE
jgi:predicted ArsR family transcriptional regulator